MPSGICLFFWLLPKEHCAAVGPPGLVMQHRIYLILMEKLYQANLGARPKFRLFLALRGRIARIWHCRAAAQAYSALLLYFGAI